jgi:outer membrane immunogenic protein
MALGGRIMKKLFVAGIAAAAFCGAPALAADLPVKAPIYKAVAPMFNWTGCYVGAHLGGGWGSKHWSSQDFGNHGSHDVDGWLGGGQIGCDYQTGQWVFGIEGDFSWARLEGDSIDRQFTDDTLHSKVDWLATATGRFGYAFDRTLLYVKGGGAWARDKYWISAGGNTYSRADETRSGWTVGTGLEYAFAPNWSAKLEYSYIDFGNERITFSCGACLANVRDIDQHIHVVKVGLNYRFNTGKAPIAARY